jgi:hypothetical protein
MGIHCYVLVYTPPALRMPARTFVLVLILRLLVYNQCLAALTNYRLHHNRRTEAVRSINKSEIFRETLQMAVG